MIGVRTLALGALGGAAMMAAAVSAPVPAAADDRPNLVVAVNALARSLESGDQTGNVDVRITYNLFDSLIRRDFLADGKGEAAKLAPGLAESWKRLGPKTVELKLREGVKFHNGDELTAEDVAFSFSRNRLYAPNSIANRGELWGHLDRVEVVDKYTVRFHTKETDALLEQRLAGYASWIVNARQYLLKGKEHFARNPVGTGPYKFAEWRDGEYIRLVAHDDYHGGKPTAASITFREVPESAARIAGLVSGEFDIIVNVAPDQIPTIDSYTDIETRSVVLSNSHVLVFNTNMPHLKDKRIRQAMALSIDRDLLRKTLWEDKNYTPNGHQLPSYDIYVADFPKFEYAPDKARQLLKEAGYKGEEIVYTIIPDYYLNSMQAAQAIQQMWKDVGINMKLNTVENWKQVRTEGWQVYPWSNTHRLPDPIGALVPLWGPRSGMQKSKVLNWQAPARFNALHHIIETSADMTERQKASREALEIWNDEVPGTILYNPLETYAVKKSIAWKPYALYYMDFRPYNLVFRQSN
ncbi:MAG: ABC transporter substrate-binding protein [Acetobacterales bacterium]